MSDSKEKHGAGEDGLLPPPPPPPPENETEIGVGIPNAENENGNENETESVSHHTDEHNMNMSALAWQEVEDGNDSGTEHDQSNFINELDHFFRHRSMDFKPPKFYGEPLNCLKSLSLSLSLSFLPSFLSTFSLLHAFIHSFIL